MSRYIFTRTSSNRKTGPIPCSYTHPDTCPNACPLRGSGCYAAAGPTALQWARTKRPEALDFVKLAALVAALPAGQLWRHNVAGDLPGDADTIDAAELEQITNANRGRRGWTYTHKPMDTRSNREAVKNANADGFTINLSADTAEEADELAQLEIAPVVVVAPAGSPDAWTTPAGRKAIRCPAEYTDTTCDRCGLCAKRDRSAIVAFTIHGSGAKKAAAAIANL